MSVCLHDCVLVSGMFVPLRPRMSLPSAGWVVPTARRVEGGGMLAGATCVCARGLTQKCLRQWSRHAEMQRNLWWNATHTDSRGHNTLTDSLDRLPVDYGPPLRQAFMTEVEFCWATATWDKATVLWCYAKCGRHAASSMKQEYIVASVGM